MGVPIVTAYSKRPFLRRGKASHRIAKTITRALGQFAPPTGLLFEPKGRFSTLELVPNKEGKLRIKKATKPGFYEELYTKEIPRRLQRRFWLLDDGPAPTPREYQKMERKILGYARRKLMRELVAKIATLPVIQKDKGGHPIEIEENEREQIRARVDELRTDGDDGEPMSKRKAAKTVADERNIGERTVWRIILGH